MHAQRSPFFAQTPIPAWRPDRDAKIPAKQGVKKPAKISLVRKPVIYFSCYKCGSVRALPRPLVLLGGDHLVLVATLLSCIITDKHL